MKSEKRLKEIIEASIVHLGAFLIRFDYRERIFGNMILDIQDIDGVIHEFILDRESIYIDKQISLAIDETKNKEKDSMFRYEYFYKIIVEFLCNTKSADEKAH